MVLMHVVVQCVWFIRAGNSRIASEPVDAQRDLSVVYEDVRLFSQEPCNLEGSITDVLTII